MMYAYAIKLLAYQRSFWLVTKPSVLSLYPVILFSLLHQRLHLWLLRALLRMTFVLLLHFLAPSIYIKYSIPLYIAPCAI